jgi:hypothetical protein
MTLSFQSQMLSTFHRSQPSLPSCLLQVHLSQALNSTSIDTITNYEQIIFQDLNLIREDDIEVESDLREVFLFNIFNVVFPLRLVLSHYLCPGDCPIMLTNNRKYKEKSPQCSYLNN